MNRISVCVITLNEGDHLPRLLNSVRGLADEIVIVDSGSKDRTAQVAKEFGAKFLSRAWTNFAEQKNFAADSSSGEWVLSLDADEQLSEELRNSLLDWKQRQPECPVYEFARRTWYLGAWIRHTTWYPDFQRRLFRKGEARFAGTVHEALRFEGRVGKLPGDLLHYTVQTFQEHEKKVEHYTTLAARQMYTEGKRSWRGAVWLATPWSWFQNYLLRGGFLEGYRGALIAQMAARSVRLKFSKLGKMIEEEKPDRAKSRVMKVLFVDLEREWRGGQSQALLTLSGLAERGVRVELLAAENAPLAERARAAGIRTHTVARWGLRGWAALAISRVVSRGGFDLLHLNEPHALTSAWLARVQRKVPLLLSRRIGFPLGKSRISRERYRAVSRFIANSRNVAASLTDSGIAPERVAIVNEGVEIPPLASAQAREAARRRWGVSNQEFLIGCVSVFVPEKGQRHLVEALAVARAVRPEIRLLLAGDGSCKSEVEGLANRLGLSGAVLFAGFVTDVGSVYAALDAFAFPSEFEGLGTALQAAMAAGLPCISTTRGALGEVVENERTALVSEPSGTGFAACFLRLVADPSVRCRLSEAGRKEIQERFSVSQMVDNTIKIYENVLKPEERG